MKIFAQSLKFENYTGKNGLLSNEISKIHQDKEGYIWIFSKYCTLKYNGIEFKTCLNNLHLRDRRITALFENDRGELWFVNSSSKLYKLRNDSAIQVLGFNDISENLHKSVNEITELCLDDSMNVYAVVKDNIFRFSKVANKYAARKIHISNDSDSCVHKLLCIGNHFFSITNDFLTKKNDGNRKCKGHFIKLSENYLVQINKNLVDGKFKQCKKFNSKYYFSGQKTIIKIDSNKVLKYILIGSEILSFAMDNKGHLWVATLHNGLYELDKNDSIIGRHLLHLTINDVIVDAQNGIWAASDGGGLFHCRSTNESCYLRHEPLGSKLTVMQIINDTLLIANSLGDIFYFKSNKCKALINDRIEELISIAKHKNYYLLSLNSGIIKSKNLNHTNALAKIERTEKPYRLFSKGADTLIYSSLTAILIEINHKIIRKLVFDHRISDVELSGNMLYIGTSGGIYCYDNTIYQFQIAKQKEGFKKKDKINEAYLIAGTEKLSISDLAVDEFGSIWFAAYGEGLYQFDNNQLKHIRQQNLPADVIHHIGFDKETILLSTNLGLFSIAGYELKNFNHTWKLLFAGDVNKTILFENKLYLSTLEGLVLIENYQLVGDTYKNVHLNFSGIELNGKEIDPFKIRNEADVSNTIAIKLNCISFNSIKPKIKYLLSGPVVDSGIVLTNSVKFNGLLPGHYILKLKIDEKYLAPNSKEVHFTIQSHFLQSTIFKALAWIVLLSLTAYMSWIYYEEKRTKNQVKEEVEKQIVEYKLIALKAQVNPHFMSNCLSAIQALVLKNNSNSASYYISQFGLLVRKILEYSDKSLITLGEELEVTRLYVEMEQLRFDNKFKYISNCDKKINVNKVYVPALILNPIIENAIWHGLLPMRTKRGRTLKIDVSITHDNILVKIKDNGVGRGQKKISDQLNSVSLGASLTEQRLQNIHYLMDQRYPSMTYHDYKDKRGESLGTEVEILLPIIVNPNKYEKNQNTGGG